MEKTDFESLCEVIDLEVHPNIQIDLDNEKRFQQEQEDQLREVWEQRWFENNSTINHRNWEERPEDYK